MKALLLAAGLGTRLRPLTQFLPKPLCQFFGVPLLDMVYRQLTQAGLSSLAVNSHYLAKQISQHIDSSPDVYSPKPFLSYEPEILGTGGAIEPLRQWLGNDELLIYNGDVVSNLKLSQFISYHRSLGCEASMVLLDEHRPGTNPVWVKGNQVLAIGEAPKGQKDCEPLTFSGIHIVSPPFLKAQTPSGSFSIIDTYQKRLAQGAKIGAYRHSGFWEDLGTPRDYYQAHRAFMQLKPDAQLLFEMGMTQSLYPESILHFFPDTQSASYGVPDLGSEVRSSFVFGPLAKSIQLDSCLVYRGSLLKPYHLYSRLIITPDCQFSWDN